MKVLNVDGLVKAPERSITLNGNKHVVVDMSVENFIESQKRAERLEKEDAPLHEQVDELIQLIVRSVPTVTREELLPIPLKSLYVIIDFLQGGDQAEEVAQEIAEEGKGADGAPKKGRSSRKSTSATSSAK